MKKEIVILNEDLNLTQPIRLGHTFLGWNVERINQNEVDGSCVQLILTTKWKENKIEVKQATVATEYYKENVKKGKIQNGYYVPIYEKIIMLDGDSSAQYKIGETAWGDRHKQIKDYIYNTAHTENIASLVITKEVMHNLKLYYGRLPNIITLSNQCDNEQGRLSVALNKSISVYLTRKIHIDVQGGMTSFVMGRARIAFENQLTTYVLEDMTIGVPKKVGFVFEGWGIKKIWNGYLKEDGIELQLTARWRKESQTENKNCGQTQEIGVTNKFQYKKNIQPAILPKIYSKVRNVLDTLFQEDKKVTRGAFAVVLVNILTNEELYPLDKNRGFIDLEKTDFAYIAAHTLISLGIIDECQDRMFRAEKDITRAEIADMLVQANGGMYEQDKDLVFKDLSKTHWAYESIQMALQSGYLKIKDHEYFNPDESVEGTEVIEILNRIYRHKSFG